MMNTPLLSSVLLACLLCQKDIYAATAINTKFKHCGLDSNAAEDIDVGESSEPGPFHDLTASELINIREFWEQHLKVKVTNVNDSHPKSSIVFMADLFLPCKREVLNFLDNNAKQPKRWARVSVLREDLFPTEVEEYTCGPLSNIQDCELLKFKRTKIPDDVYVRAHDTVNKRRKEKNGPRVQGKDKRPYLRRAPIQVEQDGKRYSIKHQLVTYLGWTFNFRLSPKTGPVLHNVRIKGERIAYEIALSDIAVLYSGNGKPMEYFGISSTFGTKSRSLVKGEDCPEFSTFINQTVLGEKHKDPLVIPSAACIFEVNNGHPLRRHLSYSPGEGGFYGGMLDSVLVVRSAIVTKNYEYLIDFIFHQNGILETRLVNTVFNPSTGQHQAGDIHQHLAHFKVDLDIVGTSNRFKTLNVVKQTVPLAQDTRITYHQTAVKQDLKNTERESVHDFNFNETKYHIIYNENSRTKYNEHRGFRLLINGMSKQLLPLDHRKESRVSWARHQLFIRRQSDNEYTSGYNYTISNGDNMGMNFRKLNKDDQSIVDQDLVAWLTLGRFYITDNEELPASTTTTGNDMSFFLLPYNYFPECPSMGSTDAMYITYTDQSNHSLGLTINRYGKSREQCIISK